MDLRMLRATADKRTRQISLWVSGRWLETAALLLILGLAGGVIAGFVGDGWSSVSIFETCYGVVLAVGIFTWTLAGFSIREADRRQAAAAQFAAGIEGRNFGQSPLDPWHHEQLARVLRVDEVHVERELLLWVIEKTGKQGPREALVVTQRLWFLRLVGRGAGGKQVLDLATGKRL